MASTSTKPKSASSETMQFVGPAQKTYQSFMELAMRSLETYCPDWNNPLKPVSYILPPLFDFKHPDKSDEDMEIQRKVFDQAKQKGNRTQNELSTSERPFIDRQSDEAEYIVNHALWKMFQESILAPVLVIHGLNLNKLKGDLQQIFPFAHGELKDRFKDMMREYDFVLIGPRIGIIVIEVKSSQFSKAKDLSPFERKLPDHVVKGINQLNSFNVDFFQECAGLQKSPGITLRKVLFTPNLEKSRFESWFNNLDQSDKEKVDVLLSGITHWFKEDMINIDPHSLKPALYWSLRQMMEQRVFEIPFEVFESYGAFIAGLRSALVLRNRQEVKLCDEQLSTMLALSKHAEMIDCQILLRKLDSLDQPPPEKKCKHDSVVNRSNQKSVVNVSSDRMILLTPEQQSALNGPQVQFIVGSAGTGKTIILLAKALELLRHNKSVLILSTLAYWKQYKILTNGYEKCHISTLEIGRSIYMSDWCHDFEFAMIEKKISEWNCPMEEVVDYLADLVKSTALSICEKVRQPIFNYDALFIDDTLDSVRCEEPRKLIRTMLCTLTLMTLAKTCYEYSPKMIWVAVDNCTPGFDRSETISWQLINQSIASKQEGFICTTLERVMRCSQSVFDAAYSREILQQMAIKPIMGHKIMGFSDVLYIAGHSGVQMLLQNLWERTTQELEKITKLGLDYSQIAIIMTTNGIRYQWHRWCDDHIKMFYLNHMYLTNSWRECLNCSMTLTDSNMVNYFLHRFPTRTCSNSLPEPEILTIATWDNVSSYEWPIVIVCSVTDQASKDSSKSYPLEYRRYRACSRATTALVEINVQRDTQAKEEEHLDAYNFHCRLRSKLNDVTKPSQSWSNKKDRQENPSSTITQNEYIDNEFYRKRLIGAFNKLPKEWSEVFNAVWSATVPDSLVQWYRDPTIKFGIRMNDFLNDLQNEEQQYYRMIIDQFCSVMAEHATKG